MDSIPIPCVFRWYSNLRVQVVLPATSVKPPDISAPGFANIYFRIVIPTSTNICRVQSDEKCMFRSKKPFILNGTTRT